MSAGTFQKLDLWDVSVSETRDTKAPAYFGSWSSYKVSNFKYIIIYSLNWLKVRVYNLVFRRNVDKDSCNFCRFNRKLFASQFFYKVLYILHRWIRWTKRELKFNKWAFDNHLVIHWIFISVGICVEQKIRTHCTRKHCSRWLDGMKQCLSNLFLVRRKLVYVTLSIMCTERAFSYIDNEFILFTFSQPQFVYIHNEVLG